MSLIDTYNAKKQLIATNLQEKGVTANADEGLTTLSNKILDIRHFPDDGIYLYSDGNVIQSNESTNIYALYIKDKKAVEGEEITFKFSKPIETTTINTSNIYNISKPIEIDAQNIQEKGTVIIGNTSYQNGAYTLKIIHSSIPRLSIQMSVYDFVIEEPIYIRSNLPNEVVGTYVSFCEGYSSENKPIYRTVRASRDIDVSYWSFDNAPSSSVTINKYVKKATTNTCGIANISYTGTGAGEIDVKAECDIFLSERYTIKDYIFLATLTSNIDSYLYNEGVDFSYTENGLSIDSGNWKGVVLNVPFTTGTVVEHDIVSLSGSPSPQYFSGFVPSIGGSLTEWNCGQTGHFKIVFENNQVKTYLDDVLKGTYNYSSATAYWRFWTGGTRKFIIKNLEVKPL